MSDKPKQESQTEIGPQQILLIMTTEHYTLEGARASTISDANGRSSLFLSAVSSGLVALAFVGQVSKMDQTFFVFALIRFPSLLFLGLVTFVRLLETALEDALYARGIARIRHYYTEIAPQTRPYFVLPTNDDMATALGGTMGLYLPTIQIFFTGAGMISVINGVLAGTFVGLLVVALFATPIPLTVVIGVIGFVIVVGLQTVFQRTQWQIAAQKMTAMFPNQNLTDSKKSSMPQSPTR